MNVFLTGITGLLGSEVARQLLERGYRIRALVRNPQKAQLQHPDIEYVQGDILDVTALAEQMQGMDQVIHTAAVVSFAPRDRNEMYKTNVEGTANVVNACLSSSIKKLGYVSSIAAFGRPPLSEMKKVDQVEIDENQKWIASGTNSHYAITKYLGECEVWRGAAEGLNMVIVNPSIILGESDWNISSTRLFKYIYDEKPFYPEGYLNYTDVKDVASALIRLMESDIRDERFCISAGMISYKEFFGQIAVRFGKKKPWFKVSAGMMGALWRLEALKSFLTGGAPLITKETAKTAQLKIFQKNNKIRETLGFEFRTLPETLDRVCAFLAGKN
ncbi:MAG: NAD-dependent epimerase/dehydratase family protein [Leadbetterella sp.]|nr:NAD-dependent epimerase/dehydratase family protein [Leadbetterella sp.]